MSDALTEFLNARIGEREALALKIQEQLDAGWNYWDELGGYIGEVVDPPGMLRRVEADRMLIALHPREEHLRPDLGPDWPTVYYCPCQCPDGIIEGEWPCETVCILAAVDSDHLDYDEKWAKDWRGI